MAAGSRELVHFKDDPPKPGGSQGSNIRYPVYQSYSGFGLVGRSVSLWVGFEVSKVQARLIFFLSLSSCCLHIQM